jgi:hypothetical protein
MHPLAYYIHPAQCCLLDQHAHSLNHCWSHLHPDQAGLPSRLEVNSDERKLWCLLTFGEHQIMSVLNMQDLTVKDKTVQVFSSFEMVDP